MLERSDPKPLKPKMKYRAIAHGFWDKWRIPEILSFTSQLSRDHLAKVHAGSAVFAQLHTQLSLETFWFGWPLTGIIIRSLVPAIQDKLRWFESD